MPAFEPGIRSPLQGSGHESARKSSPCETPSIIPPRHEIMAPEFLAELRERGRLYGYRFRPEGRLRGLPIDAYSGRCIEGKAFRVMIDNNLDFEVALYPYELVTYGETGQVCQNWMQYRLICKYLEILDQAAPLLSNPAILLASSRATLSLRALSSRTAS